VTEDPRRRFLLALKRQLRGGPLARRRILREIAAHLDDIVAELKATGRSERAAVEEAVRRLGDVDTIAKAFREIRPVRGRPAKLRSPAWIAAAAMSLVTAWAADLPQASGAKASTQTLSSTYSRQRAPLREDQRQPATRAGGEHARRSDHLARVPPLHHSGRP
jgi:hypothetical protein